MRTMRCRSVRPQHHSRRDILAQGGVRDGKGYGLRHRFMIQEHFIDFLWGDFFPAAIDHLAYAAGQKQIAVIIKVADITGLEPIAGKRDLGCFRVAIVARRDACTPDDDLAGLAAGQQSSSFVHDRDIQNGW